MREDVDSVQLVSPADGGVTEDFLTASLCWHYPMRPGGVVNGVAYPYLNYPKVRLQVSAHPEHAARTRFTTGSPRLGADAADATRYRNPREGAHWLHEQPVPYAGHEPLSPWYDVRSYRALHLPTFEEARDHLPVPVYDGHPEVLEAYWYCWKTLLHHWYFEPESPDHQAVANICGTKPWGPWGSTMVWDTAFILHFARYGHQAYPFVTALDNCYARQHENGFICRESDKDNREVYVWFPVNPPLFAWAEWQYYRISGDRERLARVFLPIVKHYEWWMTYQRRASGVYWTDPMQEADDSPRNALVHAAVSATSYQALTALCLSHLAADRGHRPAGARAGPAAPAAGPRLVLPPQRRAEPVRGQRRLPGWSRRRRQLLAGLGLAAGAVHGGGGPQALRRARAARRSGGPVPGRHGRGLPERGHHKGVPGTRPSSGPRCRPRGRSSSTSAAPCHITVRSGGEFELRVVAGGTTVEQPIRAGETCVCVGS